MAIAEGSKSDIGPYQNHFKSQSGRGEWGGGG